MAGVANDELERQEREEFHDFLRQLIEAGELGKTSEGITKLVLDKGEESLSKKQRFVFETHVLEPYSAKCDECGESVPWREALSYFHGAGRCETCQARYEKYMAED